VRCGIVRRRDLIRGFRYDDAFFDDDLPNGPPRPELTFSSESLMARAMKALSMWLGSSLRNRQGRATPTTNESARKSVDMDSFAADVKADV